MDKADNAKGKKAKNMAEELKPNEGKRGTLEVDGVSYQRLPIKTHLVTVCLDRFWSCEIAEHKLDGIARNDIQDEKCYK